MKQIIILIFISSVLGLSAFAQQKPTPKAKTVPLPMNIYHNLHDSCTSLDIVFLTGKGGSLSLEGKNVRFFTSFMTSQPAEKKPNATEDATIMWEQNGREYLSGAMYFTSDSSGYIQFSKNNKEYVNALNKPGAGFLQTHGK